MLDDALDLGAEVLASVVGWRARRKEKAAQQGEQTPLPEGEFAVWEQGRLRNRPAGRIWVHGVTVRWAGPGTEPGLAREVPGSAVRFRVERAAGEELGTQVWLQLPDTRPLTATVSHEQSLPAGSPDLEEERRLAACAAELVDLLRSAGAVEEDA